MADQSTNPDKQKSLWADDSTLGREKPFKWRLDDTMNLYIWREFKHKNTFRKVETKFPASQIKQIADYVELHKEVRLGNSVSRLGEGIEEEGLGRFMHEKLALAVTDAQASSQVATLFVRAAVWKLNRKRGMNFEHVSSAWKENLRNYYTRGVNGVITS